jgi:hypothetical protein
MPSKRITVDVDAAGNVRLSGDVNANGDITVRNPGGAGGSTNLQFRFGAATTGYRFQEFLVTTEAIACPPQAPFPAPPANNEFTIPHLPQPQVLTVVDKCTIRATYNYALGVQRVAGGPVLWFDPRIVNDPG